MHEGLDVTVQQYGFAVIFWYIYSALGPAGLYIIMLMLNIVICYLLYKIYKLISKGNVNLSLAIMVIADLLLILGGFVTTRAQMVSYCILLATIYILELYIKTDKTKYLYWLPLLSILQINLHASVWWIPILIMCAYLVDSFKSPKLHLQGYRTKPLVLALLAFFLVGFINPYGIKMVTFIFTSYGASAIVNLVNEMTSFDLRDVFNVFLYIALAATLILCIYHHDHKQIRMRYLLMLFGFLALGLNSIKGMSQLILIMFLPLAQVYRNFKIESVLDPGLGRNAIVFWSGITSVAITIALIIILPTKLPDSPGTVFASAVDAIDASVADHQEDPAPLKIYSGYDHGGYLEYRGYHPYLDSRAEVFIKKPAEDEDSILQEYINLRRGKISADAFLAKYQFDYLFVDQYDHSIYDMDATKYELIYDSPADSIRVWKRIKDN